MKRSLIAIAIFYIVFCVFSSVSATSQNPLPRPPELEPDIKFWTLVFTEVDTRHGVIHDNRNLAVIYEIVPVPENASKKRRGKIIKRAKNHYKKILLRLAKGKRKNLSAEEQRVLNLWPKGVSNKTLRTATKRLRFQLGQADKFRRGWTRSGAWRPYIEKTLAEHGIPKELAALPHVESSFNPKAYSHVGAAGLWQFTRSTGRRYLRIDHVVDERLDPFKSSEAAARLLKHNYSVTGSWPLAITAYNHGAAGMRRAARRLGTTDIVPILRHYKSRIFGFASRNFYVAFLAAVDVDKNATKYFGPLPRDPVDHNDTVKLPTYLSSKSLKSALGLNLTVLKDNNPALRPAVWNGDKYIPRGYELRLNCLPACDDVKKKLHRVAVTEGHNAQRPDLFHRVQRGQTLSLIAARYRVSLQDLVDLNLLRSKHRIRIGQILRLPQPDKDLQSIVSAANEAEADSEISLPQTADGFYKVRRGDSIAIIARRYSLTEQELLALNKVRNKHRIYVGQKLRVSTPPISAETSPAEVPTPTEQTVEPATIMASAQLEDEDINPSETDSVDIALVDSTDPEDTEPLGPALPSELHPELSADPSDYTVASDGTIEVQAAETLGHFADWLELRTQRLRNINRLKFGRPLAIGKRLKLDFSRVAPETFEQKRTAYHRDLQAEFFKKYQITGTKFHRVRRGESLWILTHRQYKLPMWLLRQYNPDLDLNAVFSDTQLIVPTIVERCEPAPATQPLPTQADSDLSTPETQHL